MDSVIHVSQSGHKSTEFVKNKKIRESKYN